MKNDKLDAIWNALPNCDRYSIDNKRYVMLWQDGHGTLLPLAEYAEGKYRPQKRAAELESTGD